MSVRGHARLGLLGMAVAALAAPIVQAHHSFAMFDNSRSITLHGKVSKYQWTNPHGYLEIDAEQTDGAITVDAEDAKEMARRCAREEGLLVGISSGATLAAIQQKLAELPAGARALGFNYDTGERYLSVPDFLPAE